MPIVFQKVPYFLDNDLDEAANRLDEKQTTDLTNIIFMQQQAIPAKRSLLLCILFVKFV
jgi:hypothetical protein